MRPVGSLLSLWCSRAQISKSVEKSTEMLIHLMKRGDRISCFARCLGVKGPWQRAEQEDQACKA